MQGDILAQGVELMLYGMGTVVVFLALLVVATSAMSKFVVRYFPEAEPTAKSLPSPVGAATKDASPGGDIIAAVSAAIHRHRSKQ